MLSSELETSLGLHESPVGGGGRKGGLLGHLVPVPVSLMIYGA